MMSNRWYLVATCVLLGLWLQAEWKWLQLNWEVDRVYSNEVTIETVDADTGKPLQIAFGGPSTTMGQRWPKEFRISSTGNNSRIRVRWIGKGPVEVSVSADGYAVRRLQLDQNSENRIVVALPRRP